jgi:flagellar export protein FliJ
MNRPLKRLERLLSLRSRTERQAKIQLALAMNEDSQRRGALQESMDQLEAAGQLRAAELRGGLKASRLALLQSYVDQRRRGQALRERLVSEWQPRLEESRKRLRAAARERQAMERWMERVAFRLRQEAERVERRRLDEIGLQEFTRRVAHEGAPAAA